MWVDFFINKWKMDICVCATPQEEEFNERIRTQSNQFRYAVVVEQRNGMKQKI